MKDEAESKTAPINNGYLNGDKKKTHYRIGDEAARSEMRSLQFSLHGRNPNAEIVSSIQLARRIRGVQTWKNRFKNDPGLMDYTQAVDKCEPDDLKNDCFPRGRDLLPKGSSIVRLLTVTSTRNYWLAVSSLKFMLWDKIPEHWTNSLTLRLRVPGKSWTQNSKHARVMFAHFHDFSLFGQFSKPLFQA